MPWGLGWRRASEIFHLTFDYGESSDNADDSLPSSPPTQSPEPHPSSNELGFLIDLEWSAGEDEEQVALRLQSQLMVALPPPQDTVPVDLHERGGDGEENLVDVLMKVMKRREPLRVVTMYEAAGSGQQSNGVGVLTRLLRSDLTLTLSRDGLSRLSEHWGGVTVLNLCGCGLLVLPVVLMKLLLLEKLYLDNNKLAQLPPELGEFRSLKVLRADNNILISVPGKAKSLNNLFGYFNFFQVDASLPVGSSCIFITLDIFISVELRQCVMLVELSLEHNKLIHPLLDFSLMAGLIVFPPCMFLLHIYHIGYIHFS